MKKIIEKYKSLNIVIKASIWFILVSSIDKAISLITQPFLNRILTVEEVGVFGVYTSWYSILLIVSSLYLFCGIYEVLLTKLKEDKKEMISSLYTLSIICSLVVFALIFIFVKPISNFLQLKPIYLVMMAVIALSETTISFWAVSKRFEYSYKQFAFVTIIVFFFKSLLSVLLAYFWTNDHVLGRLVGLAIPSVICAIVLFFFNQKGFSLKGVNKYWKKALVFNLPLIPHYLSSIVLASSDKVMIEKLVNFNDAGLYTVAYSVASLALIVFQALNSAINPFSLKCLKEEKYDELSKATNAMLICSILFSVVLIFVAPEGLRLIGGEKYMDALDIIPVLIVGVFFSSFYFIYSNVEFIYEKTKWIFPITLVGMLLNILLNYFLIPVFGYKVAAYTTFAGYLVISILHWLVARLILKKNIYNTKVLLISLACFIAIAAGSIFIYKVHFLIRYAVLLLSIIAFIVFVVKSKIFSSLFSKSISEEK